MSLLSSIICRRVHQTHKCCSGSFMKLGRCTTVLLFSTPSSARTLYMVVFYIIPCCGLREILYYGGGLLWQCWEWLLLARLMSFQAIFLWAHVSQFWYPLVSHEKRVSPVIPFGTRKPGESLKITAGTAKTRMVIPNRCRFLGVNIAPWEDVPTDVFNYTSRCQYEVLGITQCKNGNMTVPGLARGGFCRSDFCSKTTSPA